VASSSSFFARVEVAKQIKRNKTENRDLKDVILQVS
jgi:hypothetical protein